jgi:hypothetical protein
LYSHNNIIEEVAWTPQIFEFVKPLSFDCVVFGFGPLFESFFFRFLSLAMSSGEKRGAEALGPRDPSRNVRNRGDLALGGSVDTSGEPSGTSGAAPESVLDTDALLGSGSMVDSTTGGGSGVLVTPGQQGLLGQAPQAMSGRL